jgi:capsular polysaccharide biosynthesis protein
MAPIQKRIMKVIDFIRLCHKHLRLLVIAPILLTALVFVLTLKPHYKFSSDTTLYTGIATGSSVEMDKSFNFFATNTAFDNLINIVNSRETQKEVAIRLLSQHLLLREPDPKYISARSFEKLKKITPPYIYRLVVRAGRSASQRYGNHGAIAGTDSLGGVSGESHSSSFKDTNDYINSDLFPASIDRDGYEQTVKNLTELMESSDTNFIYKLLNFPNTHYSFSEISTIKASRISNSDLVQLQFESDDPGICQQTLSLLIDVCIRNYKNIKSNRSDAVVRYFESQLSHASSRLEVAEDKLLDFNKDNNIINYYEQSKAVAVVKEDLDVEYNDKRIKLAGIQAAIKRLEEKLGIQQQIQLKSAKILDKQNQLGEINYQIASAETVETPSIIYKQKLADLNANAEKLKSEIKDAVAELYSYGNSIEGLPINTILNDWINNVIEAENIKAGLLVLGDRIREFQKQYAVYAPAGANIKRIEREISVSEQEYLEILHGLNLAKLKMQDIELSSNIKAVDPPYYPISPIPTKRKILVIIAALLGIIIVLTSIFVTEYFDNTLKNPTKASKILRLHSLGLIPKILLKTETINFPFLLNRLLEFVIQNLEMNLRTGKSEKTTKTLLFFSTSNREGKTVIIGNLAKKLKEQGKKVLVLNYSGASMQKNNIRDFGKPEINLPDNIQGSFTQQNRFSFINRILGYPDNRINFTGSFLDPPENYLSKEEYQEYNFSETFYQVINYEEIMEQNGFSISYMPDFILIELPPILYYSYPMNLVSNSDLLILICRSNRTWTEAEQEALTSLIKLNEQETHYILNGVGLAEIESILGNLPKKRSWIRRKVKNQLNSISH